MNDVEFETEQGVKLSSKKPKLSLLKIQFPRALEAITRASEYGHNKYRDTDVDYKNFLRVPNAEWEYRNAIERHESDRETKGYLDDESGLPHIYHKAWNALAELETHLINQEEK